MTVMERETTGLMERPHVEVIQERCAGCEECVVRCPAEALAIDPSNWVALADDSLCVGCRQCVRTCPFSAITVEGPVLVDPPLPHGHYRPTAVLGDTSETRLGFTSWDAAVAEAERCLSCPDPTCVRGCPAHNDIPAFVAAVARRDLASAHDIIRRTSVLPDICSRVCDQRVQCEGACTWSLAGGAPVAIGALERFICDNAEIPGVEPKGSAGEGLDVCVIGAGPAGMAAAWELMAAGAKVTLFDKDEEPLGVLRWGIPSYTLPDAVAWRPWHALEAAGAVLNAGSQVDPAQVDGLLERHDAVVLATGAPEPLVLRVPGAELDGVEDATSFLTRAKSALGAGESLDDVGPSSTVLVLGAGNTAMDVARSVLRLGGQAICIDWMNERFALVRPDELAEAREEGVEARFNRSLLEIKGEAGQVKEAVLVATEQPEPGVQPRVLSSQTERIAVDRVVMAMGYRPDASLLAAELGGSLATRRFDLARVPDRSWLASGIMAAPSIGGRAGVGQLALGREQAYMASAWSPRARLWAVGDALCGPSTVVEAMAQGRRAAQAVIAAQPKRPGHRSGGMAGYRRVLVAYDSRGGNTRKAAETVAQRLGHRGPAVDVLPITSVGPDELASADLLVLGTWTDGMIVGGMAPAPSTVKWMTDLPRLAGKDVAVFCTYAVNAGRAPARLAAAMGSTGANVVADGSVSRWSVEQQAARFAGEVIDAVEKAGSPMAGYPASGSVGVAKAPSAAGAS